MKLLVTLVASSLTAGAVIAHDDEHTDPYLADIAHFFEGAQVMDGPRYVDCTLSGGTETTCFSITVKAAPTAYTPGPWCPRNVSDDADVSGIWLHDGAVLDADGDFMANLATLFGDDAWQMVNPETGDIRVTDSFETCQAAARPDVTEEYANYCVECLPEYLDADATQTYVIPVQPHKIGVLSRAGRVGPSGSGVALNGIKLDGPAPVDAILGAYTVAPFDDCGGHVNPFAGYHYHAVTDCLVDRTSEPEHAAQIGFAMDGFDIYTHLLANGSAPDDLDRCYGHDTDAEGYHYHAGAAGSNAILGCFMAETGCVLDDPDAVCAANERPARPQ